MSAKKRFRFRRLRRSELPVDTETLARYLIGKILVHDLPEGRLAGKIVETEAYVLGDAAAHAYRGKTARNQSLFLERGHAYVYFTYGNWYCLNVSGETAGVGGGALLRAVEPLEGVERMRDFRGGAPLTDLARGPGRLAVAFRIGREHDGLDLCGNERLWLAAAVQPPKPIGRSPRIGLTKEAHRLLRFFERGSPFVSGPKYLSKGPLC